MYERSDGWITTLASPSFRAAREVGGSQDGRRDGLKPGPLREDFDTGDSRTRPILGLRTENASHPSTTLLKNHSLETRISTLCLGTTQTTTDALRTDSPQGLRLSFAGKRARPRLLQGGQPRRVAPFPEGAGHRSSRKLVVQVLDSRPTPLSQNSPLNPQRSRVRTSPCTISRLSHHAAQRPPLSSWSLAHPLCSPFGAEDGALVSLTLTRPAPDSEGTGQSILSLAEER